MKNLRIRTKLLLLVAVLIGFNVAVSWIGFGAFREGESAIESIYSDRVVPLRDLKMIADAYAVDIVDTAHKARAGTLGRDVVLKNIREANTTIHDRWNAYLATYLVDREKALVRELDPLFKEADRASQKLEQLIQTGKADELDAFVRTALYSAVDPVGDKLHELIELQINVAKETHDAAVAHFDFSRRMMAVLVVLALLISLVLSYVTIRAIAAPINQAKGIIERLAQGDLSSDIVDNGGRDEVSDMIRATGQISATLKRVAGDLTELIEAARGGSLSVRADASVHRGDFAKLIVGANQIVDTLSAPLHEVASVMARLASGDVKGRMTGEYAGELRALKGNVNRSLDALGAVLDALSIFARALADGDLRHGVDGNFQGEFAAMKVNLNKAADQLRAVLSEVGQATRQVSASSQETTAAALEVSKHAAGQMSALIDVSGAIEQTTAAISEIASNADKANVLAGQAVGAAEGGQQTLSALTTAVHGIADKNKRITQISELIGNIADKTYVLSLNAGLEAARAGEQGGGFALIAHKIGALAEEVAQATRDIRSLVLEATQSVEAGVGTAVEARSSMGRIVDLAQHSGHTIKSIAAAIEEQSAMAKLIRERVAHLQTVGQTTAAAAEEISATMKVMSGMAQHLQAEAERIRTA